jgi:hypothetical protein
MSIKRVILNLKINPTGDFYPLSSILKLIGVIIAPVVFLAISGRSPYRVSWYFLILVVPFIVLSLVIGFFRFTRTSDEDLSISHPNG